MLWFVVKGPLRDKVIGIIDVPLQGEILMQGNLVYNFAKGNALHYFKTDYLNYPIGENLRFAIANSWHLYMYIPLRFFFGIIESYNALVIIIFLLNFLAAYLLAKYLFSSKSVAFCSALVFALNPYVLLKMNLGFLQKIALFPMPLYCLMLFRLRDTMRLRYAYLAGVLLCLIQLTYPPYSVYMILFTLPLAVYWSLKQKARLSAAGRFIFILLIHFSLTAFIYYLMGFGFVYLNSLKPITSISAEGCLDLFRPFLFFPYQEYPKPIHLPLGISAICFLCSIFIAIKKKGLPRLLFINLLMFVIIAAGPYLVHNGKFVYVLGHKVILPFYFMAKFLPFAGGIFYPIRVFPFINLSLAILTGYTLLYLSTNLKRLRPVFIAAVFLFIYLPENLILFSRIFPPKISNVNIPQFYQKIKDENFQAILHLPVTLDARIQNRYGYYAVLSGKKIMNSYWNDKLSIYLPKDSDDIEAKGRFIEQLSRWDVRYIIINQDILRAGGGAHEVMLGFGWLRVFCGDALSYPEDNLLVYKISPPGKTHKNKGVIYIPGDFSSIQRGIEEALDGDTLLVAPGTYKENINFKRKAITIKSQTMPEATIIEGKERGSVVVFNSGEDSRSILQGFTICNGSGTVLPLDNSQGGSGGGIICINSSPKIVGNIIRRNKAENGGGICCLQGSSPLILNNIINDNEATKGGGIRLSMQSSPEIVGNIIFGNRALRLGGGIYWRAGSYPVIRNNIITRNFAGEGGGGLFGSSYIKDAIQKQGVVITNCLIRNNISPVGPSIAFGGSPLKVRISHCNIEGGRDGISDPRRDVAWEEGNIDRECADKFLQ